MLPVYEGTIWRPPSEARSLILQATVGCSNNTCTFCGPYKTNGDALVIRTQQLIDTLDFLYNEFPRLERVGVYASPQNLLQKSKNELAHLKEHGLGIIYLGVETGLDPLLEGVKKGVTRQQMICVGQKIVESQILLSVTIIIGLEGPECSEDHARETASILNSMKPDYTGALTLMLVEGTELYQQYKRGEFTLPTPGETLQEMRWLIESVECKTMFRSSHASNYLPIGGNLPEDRKKLLQEIKRAQEKKMYKSEYLQGL